MSRFTSTVGTTETAGVTSDMFTRNALACAGTGALLGVGTGSVLAVAVAAPLQVAGITLAASGAIYAGNRMADGKSLNPFTKKEDEKSQTLADQGIGVATGSGIDPGTTPAVATA